jgi:hypothetical protein
MIIAFPGRTPNQLVINEEELKAMFSRASAGGSGEITRASGSFKFEQISFHITRKN